MDSLSPLTEFFFTISFPHLECVYNLTGFPSCQCHLGCFKLLSSCYHQIMDGDSKMILPIQIGQSSSSDPSNFDRCGASEPHRPIHVTRPTITNTNAGGPKRNQVPPGPPSFPHATARLPRKFPCAPDAT